MTVVYRVTQAHIIKRIWGKLINSQMNYHHPFFFGINTVNPLFLVVQNSHIYGSDNEGMPSPIEVVSHTIKRKKKKKREMQGGCMSNLNWMGVDCGLKTPSIQQCDRCTRENSTVQPAFTGRRKRKRYNAKQSCSWSIRQIFEVLVRQGEWLGYY